MIARLRREWRQYSPDGRRDFAVSSLLAIIALATLAVGERAAPSRVRKAQSQESPPMSKPLTIDALQRAFETADPPSAEWHAQARDTMRDVFVYRHFENAGRFGDLLHGLEECGSDYRDARAAVSDAMAIGFQAHSLAAALAELTPFVLVFHRQTFEIRHPDHARGLYLRIVFGPEVAGPKSLADALGDVRAALLGARYGDVATLLGQLPASPVAADNWRRSERALRDTLALLVKPSWWVADGNIGRVAGPTLDGHL